MSSSVTRALVGAVGIAGVGGAASAQVATYQVRFGNNASAITLAPGQSTQVTVLVAFSPGIGGAVTTGPLTGPVLGLSDGAFNLSATTTAYVAASWSNLALNAPYNYLGWLNPGTLNGLSVNDVVWGCGFVFAPGSHPSPVNPDDVWTGVLTINPASGGGVIELTAAYVISTGVYASGGASALPFVSQLDDLPGSGTVTVCYADCNQSGGLTVADFSCFQTRWVQGDPYADCNGGGSLTIADFGCFQTQFVAGCP